MCLAQGPQRSGVGEARTRVLRSWVKHSTTALRQMQENLLEILHHVRSPMSFTFAFLMKFFKCPWVLRRFFRLKLCLRLWLFLGIRGARHCHRGWWGSNRWGYRWWRFWRNDRRYGRWSWGGFAISHVWYLSGVQDDMKDARLPASGKYKWTCVVTLRSPPCAIQWACAE